MTSGTFTLIVVAVLCILYIIDRLPVALVTMLGVLAMVFGRVLTSKEAFGNFGSTPVLLTFGMVVIIDAVIDSGLIVQYEHVLQRMTGQGEKMFLVLVFLSAGIISMFTNNSALVAMFMPFIASTARSTGGKISKKHLYMPLAMGGLIGGTGSLAGSTAPLLANEVLKISDQEQFSFFTTAPVSLSILAVVAVCFWFFLYDLMVKWFDFEEAADDGKPIKEVSFNKRNAAISLTVFATTVVLFITQPFGWDLGLIAITGAVVVITLRCVDAKYELKHMMWPALITLGGALAIADGFVKSGAGEMVINFLVGTFGRSLTQPKVMVALFLLAGWLISMFMSNGSLVSMLAAVAVPMAVSNNINPMPVAIACVIGANLAMATPVATTTITMVQVAGYRFRDYFKLGGTVGIIGILTAWTSIVLLYGL